MRTLTTRDWLGLTLIALCVVLLAGAVGFAGLEGAANRGIDPVTLCPVNSASTGITEVLIDVTDPFTPEQARALRVRLRHLSQVELHRNEMLTVWGIGEFEEGSIRRLFCRCNPGRVGNWFYQDPVAIEARFDSLFGDTLSRLAASMTLSGHSPTSPILESIQQVSELPEFARAVGPRRIIVVSDMMQNTQRFSSYRPGSGYDLLPRTPPFMALRADLRRTTVEIIYLPRKRDERFQGPEHRAFWRNCLRGYGATQVEFDLL